MGKDLQTLNGQNRLAIWAGRISECRSSGQNVKAWCRENGVCEQTYYKWQKRLFEMAQAQQEVQFAEVTPVHSAVFPLMLSFAKHSQCTKDLSRQIMGNMESLFML